MISIYQFKPQFQNLLRPLVARLAHRGVTANSVTVTAMVFSLAIGALLWQFGATTTSLFSLLPVWMFVRMALNAIDGMLAREFGQQSPLGAYLNELTDVVSDAALFLPFALIAPFDPYSVGTVIFLSTLSEMTGAMAPMVGAPRQYQGPMGKSDRAFLFGTLGLGLSIYQQLPAFVFWLMPLASFGIGLNIIHRIRGGLAASKP